MKLKRAIKVARLLPKGSWVAIPSKDLKKLKKAIDPSNTNYMELRINGVLFITCRTVAEFLEGGK